MVRTLGKNCGNAHVRGKAGQITIEPVGKKAYDLDKLLKAITSKNQHEAVEFGPAAGKEA